MTKEKLAEIRDRLMRATPGPWAFGGEAGEGCSGCDAEEIVSLTKISNYPITANPKCTVPMPWTVLWAQIDNSAKKPEEWKAFLCFNTAEDARFFAHAWQDIQDLLTEVDQLCRSAQR